MPSVKISVCCGFRSARVGVAIGYIKWDSRAWFSPGKFLGRSEESHTGWKFNHFFPIGRAFVDVGATLKSRFGRGHLC